MESVVELKAIRFDRPLLSGRIPIRTYNFNALETADSASATKYGSYKASGYAEGVIHLAAC